MKQRVGVEQRIDRLDSSDERVRIRTLEQSVEHLHGPEEVPYAEDELVVVCLVRDGRPHVKYFVEHYSSMGVKHIAFLDNGSTDGTVEALKEYENVTVLRTMLPFKEYKHLMRRYLQSRFGKDRWSLCVDIDELFDYPYSDVVGLSSFLGYLNSNSYTAVIAQMLDMFPEEPLSGQASNPDEPLKETCRFYDISNLRRESMKEHHQAHLRNNTIESDEIEAFRGGIRETLFGFRPYLTKHPLVFLDGRVEPFHGSSSHWVNNARVADITCVIFHYKFVDGHFRERAVRAVREEQYWKNSAAYKKYLKVLDKNSSLQVKQESSRELRSVNDLVENLFLVVSEEYMMLVYHEERKGARGRATGGGGPEEDEAFYRAKAEAKVQSLRARRLEQRLKELGKQHQEQEEKLREQYQRRLARAQKTNRNLRRQLQGIQASRSWRLLGKLGRLWAKVPGKKG